jgi:hypothetical protein
MMASAPATNRNELSKITPDFVGTVVSEQKLYVYGGYVTAPAREKQEEERAGGVLL